jgi:hypothetical protein
MNYLVIEGYKDAAEKFANETAIAPNVELESIQDRMDVRHAIQKGSVEEAIERVNDLDPEVHIHTYSMRNNPCMMIYSTPIDIRHQSQAFLSSSTTTVN